MQNDCRCPAAHEGSSVWESKDCVCSVPAQFGGQEPGSNAEIKKFAQARGAKYPIMAKIDVNGSGGASSLLTFCRVSILRGHHDCLECLLGVQRTRCTAS